MSVMMEVESSPTVKKLKAHIDFLKKNIPPRTIVFMRRMQCLSDFVSCFDSKLKELKITHLFPDHVQWFSYWISKQGREGIEQHFKRNKTKRHVNSLLFEFVRPLISPDRGYFDFIDESQQPRKAFFRYEEENGWKQEISSYLKSFWITSRDFIKRTR